MSPGSITRQVVPLPRCTTKKRKEYNLRLISEASQGTYAPLWGVSEIRSDFPKKNAEKWNV